MKSVIIPLLELIISLKGGRPINKISRHIKRELNKIIDKEKKIIFLIKKTLEYSVEMNFFAATCIPIKIKGDKISRLTMKVLYIPRDSNPQYLLINTLITKSTSRYIKKPIKTKIEFLSICLSII
jgi:hypothetical protein